MSVPPSSFTSAIPGWMSEAYGHPSAAEAMQWLLAMICQQLGAEACIVLRINDTGTHGAAAWTHGTSMQSVSRELFPLHGSASEHALSAPSPVALELALLGADPWLANRGITGGAMVALQQGPVRFGSLGVYFTHDNVDVAETLSVLAEVRLMLWPLLCWLILGMERGTTEHGHTGDAPGTVHRANNILSNIVLLTDLALDMPCAKQDESMHVLLERIAAESVRCASVLRELGPG